MNFVLKISLRFFTVTLLCLILNEIVKYQTAKYLGYTDISHFFGRIMYNSSDSGHQQIIGSQQRIDVKDIDLINNIPSVTDKLSNQLWIKNQAIIEFSSKLFMITISVIGILIASVRKNRFYKFNEGIDWIFIMLSLYILKGSSISAFFLIRRSVFCDYGMFSEYFGLPLWGTESFILVIGLSMTCYILLNIVPRVKVVEFISGSLIGGLMAIIAWISLVVLCLS